MKIILHISIDVGRLSSVRCVVSREASGSLRLLRLVFVIITTILVQKVVYFLLFAIRSDRDNGVARIEFLCIVVCLRA